MSAVCPAAFVAPLLGFAIVIAFLFTLGSGGHVPSVSSGDVEGGASFLGLLTLGL